METESFDFVIILMLLGFIRSYKVLSEADIQIKLVSCLLTWSVYFETGYAFRRNSIFSSVKK
jgi:hypothetical protein